MRPLPFLALLLLVVSLSAEAQDITTVAGLNRASAFSITPSDSFHSGPFAGKRFGVEFNPVRFLMGIFDLSLGKTIQLSGGFSLFAIDRNAEIAFPMLYVSGSNDGIPWKLFYLDATYRRFTGKQQRGFYYSAGCRYSYVTGAEVLHSNVHTTNEIAEQRFGLYGGIGFRVYWRPGFYYGANLMLGRYFNKDIRHVGDSDIDTGPVIWDSELLKIGYAF